jgi:FkbM family methyltransferase
LIDFLYGKLPKNIFLIKNALESPLLKDATITRHAKEIRVTLNGRVYELRLDSSDFKVFHQIVLEGELNMLIGFGASLNRKDLLILDCGANIGLSSLTLKHNFPTAKVISIEPERSNYLQLCKNIAINNLKDVTPLEIGVWHKETILEPDLDFRDGSNWSFALKEGSTLSNRGIRVNSISNIVAQLGWTRIDILKMDIEGSEFEIFKNLHTWRTIFETVKIISIEIHDEKGSRIEIESILLRSGFTLHKSGELLIGVRT